eukprot:1148452-Pelagomonas_calceolata.AAC.1
MTESAQRDVTACHQAQGLRGAPTPQDVLIHPGPGPARPPTDPNSFPMSCVFIFIERDRVKTYGDSKAKMALKSFLKVHPQNRPCDIPLESAHPAK